MLRSDMASLMLTGRPINILLVEDDPAHAEIVKRNLQDFRIANRLKHLPDGQAALDYLQQVAGSGKHQENEQPDLVLLDLRLPKVDGVQVLSRMKADADLRRIPVVILTTSSAEQDMVAAYTNGAGSYLVKPVDFDKFRALLEAFGFYWLAWNQFPHHPE